MSMIVPPMAMANPNKTISAVVSHDGRWPRLRVVYGMTMPFLAVGVVSIVDVPQCGDPHKNAEVRMAAPGTRFMVTSPDNTQEDYEGDEDNEADTTTIVELGFFRIGCIVSPGVGLIATPISTQGNHLLDSPSMGRNADYSA